MNEKNKLLKQILATQLLLVVINILIIVMMLTKLFDYKILIYCSIVCVLLSSYFNVIFQKRHLENKSDKKVVEYNLFINVISMIVLVLILVKLTLILLGAIILVCALGICSLIFTTMMYKYNKK